MPLRMQQGVLPALVQGPLSRFGDTAANTGILTLMNSIEATKDLNIGFKTVAASVAAALFRIVLMPVDTVKTTMQVTGKFSSVVDKMRASGPLTLYNGSLAAASATFVGHYPYVYKQNGRAVCLSICPFIIHIAPVQISHSLAPFHFAFFLVPFSCVCIVGLRLTITCRKRFRNGRRN
jgi:hypothetical protein